MKAIIMVRSRHEENRLNQEDICRKYAEENGIEIVDVIDGFEPAVKGAIKSDTDCVIISERSRVSRDFSSFRFIMIMFNLLNMKLVCVNETK